MLSAKCVAHAFSGHTLYRLPPLFGSVFNPCSRGVQESRGGPGPGQWCVVGDWTATRLRCIGPPTASTGEHKAVGLWRGSSHLLASAAAANVGAVESFSRHDKLHSVNNTHYLMQGIISQISCDNAVDCIFASVVVLLRLRVVHVVEWASSVQRE